MTNYANAHLEKVHEDTWKQVLFHASREASETEKNVNIDRSRSKNNLYRKIVKPDAFLPFKKENIDPKVVRKDQVLFGEITLSVSDDSIIKDNAHFFEACCEFLDDFFGAERWFGSALHADELSVHVHAFVMPLIEDKLCSKVYFNAMLLKSMQDSFASHLIASGYKVKRGIPDSGVKHDGQKYYSSMVNKALSEEEIERNDLIASMASVIRGKKKGLMQSMGDYQEELIIELETLINDVFPRLAFASSELKKYRAKFESLKKFNSKLAKKLGDEASDIFAPLVHKQVDPVRHSDTMRMSAKPNGGIDEGLKEKSKKALQRDYRPGSL